MENEVKKIYTRIGGAGKREKVKEVTLKPGDTFDTVKKKLKLKNADVFRLDSDEAIPHNADLYDLLNDGEKIIVTILSIVGEG